MLDQVEISSYKTEMERELENILSYWMQFAVDDQHGGFYGKINDDNEVVAGAAKGSVLNSRILWSFSAAYRLKKNEAYLAIASRAFEYIRDHFADQEYGGVYWTVDHNGLALDTKKQIYALAFCLYGTTEYFLATGDEASRALSLNLYHTIEQYSHDEVNGGYLEALSRDWQQLQDLRLSSKDANEKKSMNTHLHVLEAYTNLYRIWPAAELKEQIAGLLDLFLKYIIDADHLVLFFDDSWNKRSSAVSFGHDIEAAWLLAEAAEIIHDDVLIRKIKLQSMKLVSGALEGVDADGGLFYEKEHGKLVAEKHWWVQAEAMVGFVYAWQVSGEDKYLQTSLQAWEFVKRNLLHPRGEWIWGLGADGAPMHNEDKAGLWKCPYHNSRACMELMKRL